MRNPPGGRALSARAARGADGRLTLWEAVRVAALPHRMELYRSGGWAQSKGPGSPEWQSFLSRYFTVLELDAAAREADLSVQKAGQTPLFAVDFWSGEYPGRLRVIFDPPAVLFASAPLDKLSFDDTLAVVGTRNPAPIARAAAEEFVRELPLTRPGCLLVSGFARGIDGCAHRSAIANRVPNIAVLGSGLLRPGPASNLDIPRRARSAGVPFVFVTEFPPARPAYASNFPRRNRIIAGLSQATVVFQAPWGSGALITAQFALEEGRDVAVFHHPLLSGRGLNEGGLKLISEGAAVVELPQLDARIVREPMAARPHDTEARPEQLEFWRSHNAGELRPLGGGNYIRST